MSGEDCAAILDQTAEYLEIAQQTHVANQVTVEQDPTEQPGGGIQAALILQTPEAPRGGPVTTVEKNFVNPLGRLVCVRSAGGKPFLDRQERHTHRGATAVHALGALVRHFPLPVISADGSNLEQAGKAVLSPQLQSAGIRPVRFTLDVVSPKTPAEKGDLAAWADKLGADRGRFGTELTAFIHMPGTDTTGKDLIHTYAATFGLHEA